MMCPARVRLAPSGNNSIDFALQSSGIAFNFMLANRGIACERANSCRNPMQYGYIVTSVVATISAERCHLPTAERFPLRKAGQLGLRH